MTLLIRGQEVSLHIAVAVRFGDEDMEESVALACAVKKMSAEEIVLVVDWSRAEQRIAKLQQTGIL